jgi:hypothetical protein
MNQEQGQSWHRKGGLGGIELTSYQTPPSLIVVPAYYASHPILAALRSSLRKIGRKLDGGFATIYLAVSLINTAIVHKSIDNYLTRSE